MKKENLMYKDGVECTEPFVEHEAIIVENGNGFVGVEVHEFLRFILAFAEVDHLEFKRYRILVAEPGSNLIHYSSMNSFIIILCE